MFQIRQTPILDKIFTNHFIPEIASFNGKCIMPSKYVEHYKRIYEDDSLSAKQIKDIFKSQFHKNFEPGNRAERIADSFIFNKEEFKSIIKEYFKKHEILSHLNSQPLPDSLFLYDLDLSPDDSKTVSRILNNQKSAVYYPKFNRFYTVGESLQTMRSDLRFLLMPQSKGYYDLDFKSAHLSIFASIANSQIIKLYLKSDISKSLADFTGTTRKYIKSILNAIIYASKPEYFIMGGRKVDGFYITPTEEGIKIGNKLKEHPFIKELLSCKERINNSIIKDNGLKDVNNNFVKLSNKIFNKNGTQSPSKLLAYVCNSYEIELKKEIYKLQDQYKVVLDMHDGVTVWIDPEEFSAKERLKIVDKIKNKIDKEAKKIGIVTKLEVKN